jgi:hypothetical protein
VVDIALDRVAEAARDAHRVLRRGHRVVLALVDNVAEEPAPVRRLDVLLVRREAQAPRLTQPLGRHALLDRLLQRLVHVRRPLAEQLLALVLLLRLVRVEHRVHLADDRAPLVQQHGKARVELAVLPPLLVFRAALQEREREAGEGASGTAGWDGMEWRVGAGCRAATIQWRMKCGCGDNERVSGAARWQV